MVIKSKTDKLLSSRLKYLFSASSKGFSLVELAMVLVIVGIIIAVGTPLMRTLVTNIKYSNSRDIVQAAVDSVESFSAGNNTLPGVTGTGNATTFINAVKNPYDAFNQPLIYLFDANLSAASPTTSTICGRGTAAISVTTSTNTINNVAFVVFSASSGRAVVSKLNGNAITASGSATGTITLDTTGNDIVQWVTINELRTKIGCMSSQLTILNTELPYAYGASSSTATPYSATIYATGGVTNYSWCIQTAAAPGGLTFTVGATSVSTQTTTCGSGSTLTQGNSVVIGGSISSTTSTTGSYALTFYVQDSNPTTPNTATKTIVLSVYP
ncbi:MAG: prepilin-type N-terminal cleavage/methylation domain-containing protein [Nitrospirae bacterium]|nr:prepilin-type N-terminal cleavage/methylation domain-containing protein [Nitrospirota bacterium]